MNILQCCHINTYETMTRKDIPRRSGVKSKIDWLAYGNSLTFFKSTLPHVFRRIGSTNLFWLRGYQLNQAKYFTIH